MIVQRHFTSSEKAIRLGKVILSDVFAAYRRLILSMTHEPADRRTYALPYANYSARLPMTLTTAASGPVATGRENPKTILDAGQRAEKALMPPNVLPPTG